MAADPTCPRGSQQVPVEPVLPSSPRPRLTHCTGVVARDSWGSAPFLGVLTLLEVRAPHLHRGNQREIWAKAGEAIGVSKVTFLSQQWPTALYFP